MVYVDNSRISAILAKTGLYTKYPAIADKKAIFSSYLMRVFGNYQPYQRLGRKLNTCCRKYAVGYGQAYLPGGITKKTFGDYLEQYCVRDMYIFYCFYQHQLADFNFSKYLSNFFGKPIETIVSLFESLNMDRDIPHACTNQAEVKDAMKKIFTNYLMFTVAKVFAQVDVAIQSNTLNALCHFSNYANLVSLPFQKIMRSAIKMDQPIDFSEDSAVKIVEQMYDYCDADVEQDTIRSFLTEVYQNNKRLYHFFVEHTIDDILNLCKKNPDLEMMVGRYYVGKKIVTKDFVTRCIANNHFWIINNLLNDIHVYQENEQVKGLRVNTKVPKKKIIIEV